MRTERGASGLVLLSIAYVAFASLGLPDAVIGVAWPSVRDEFGLQQSGLGLVLFGTGSGYFLSGFLTGSLIRRWGIGTLLAASSGLVALSLFGYATTPTWPVLLVCALAAGLGSGAIDAGLNTYAARHFSVRHVNWLHACYSFGAMAGPLLMTGVLAYGLVWRWGYASIGAVLLVMTTTFVATRSVWSDGASAEAPGHSYGVGMGAALRHPLVWLQMAIFFAYTGVEITLGQWSYTVFTEGRAVGEETAGLWSGLYWGSIAAGRVLLGFVVERLGPDRLLRVGMVGVVIGSILFAVGTPILSLFGLLVAGTSLAPVFPTLMSRTPGRLGEEVAAHAVGFQVSAAMLGSAVVPSIAGLLATDHGLEVVGTVAVVTSAALLVLHEVLFRLSSRPSAIRDEQRMGGQDVE